MMQDPFPLVQDMVLIGGGHAHALVLRMWAMDPLPGVRLTVINPNPAAPYTGMLPGFIATQAPAATASTTTPPTAIHACLRMPCPPKAARV